GITVTAVADYTFSNTRSSSDSYARQLAYGAAESGMNAGLSALYHSGSYHSKTFGDQSAPASLAANPRYTVSYTWTATVTDPIWTVTATGKVLNVTGGTKAVAKTLKRTLRVQAAAGGQGVNPTVWNYIYSDAPPGNCMQLSNNALISAPLYVRGDLCLSNNAAVTQNATFTSLYPSTPQLQVGGTVTIGNNGYIGTSGSRLNAVQTGAGCGSPAHNPCTTGDGVWATSYVTTPPTFTKPVIDLATWYDDAAPGPKHACTSSTGSPPAFDNNGVQDNS